MFIHLSLAGLSVLFTHKYLSFVNLSLFLHDVSNNLVGTSLYFAQTSETSLEGARTFVQNWHL